MGYEWNDETAEQYARKYGECATNRLPVEEIQLPSNAIIVDIGCGTGATLRRAADFVTKGVLIGIDPVPRMLEIARELTAAHPAVDHRDHSTDQLFDRRLFHQRPDAASAGSTARAGSSQPAGGTLRDLLLQLVNKIH